jgi:hypothetical protein
MPRHTQTKASDSSSLLINHCVINHINAVIHLAGTVQRIAETALPFLKP